MLINYSRHFNTQCPLEGSKILKGPMVLNLNESTSCSILGSNITTHFKHILKFYCVIKRLNYRKAVFCTRSDEFVSSMVNTVRIWCYGELTPKLCNFVKWTVCMFLVLVLQFHSRKLDVYTYYKWEKTK